MTEQPKDQENELQDPVHVKPEFPAIIDGDIINGKKIELPSEIISGVVSLPKNSN